MLKRPIIRAPIYRDKVPSIFGRYHQGTETIEVGSKDLMMFGETKTAKLMLKPQLFTIRWFPSSRSFGSARRRKFRPNLMPPLMVRKPEWRR